MVWFHHSNFKPLKKKQKTVQLRIGILSGLGYLSSERKVILRARHSYSHPVTVTVSFSLLIPEKLHIPALVDLNTEHALKGPN